MKEPISCEETKEIFEWALQSEMLTTEERKLIEKALTITEQEIIQQYYKSRLRDAQRYLIAEHGIEECAYKYHLPPLYFNEADSSNEDDNFFDARLVWSLEDEEPDSVNCSLMCQPPRSTLIEIIWPMFDPDYKNLIDHELGHWIDVQLNGDKVMEDPHGKNWVRIMMEAFERDESGYQDLLDLLEAENAYLIDQKNQLAESQIDFLTSRLADSNPVFTGEVTGD